jgi:hypothetical protein
MDKQRGSRGKRGKKTRESRSKLSERVRSVFDPDLGRYVQITDSKEISTSVITERANVFWDCAEGSEETPETHIVPRRSLTKQQLLKFRDPIFEESLMLGQVATKGEYKGKQIGANPKYSITSDKTLLNRGIPQVAKPMVEIDGLPYDPNYYKRETSRTKRAISDPDYARSNRPDRNQVKIDQRSIPISVREIFGKK